MKDDFGFIKVKHVTVTEQVSKQIKDMIESGRFKPGDKLPSQKELEQMMGVSRPTLREAISRLISSGTVEARQGQGYYVKEPNLNVNISAQLLQYDERKVRDLFEARLFLEATLSQLAATFATDEELENLLAICKRFEADDSLAQNSPFGDNYIHALIAEYSHNKLLADFERSILELMEEYPDIFVSKSNETYQEKYETVPHRNIIDAIYRRDPIAAYNEAIRHILVYTEDAGLEKKYEFPILKEGHPMHVMSNILDEVHS